MIDPQVLEDRFVEALGRQEHQFDLREPLAALANERILVTGAAGMIGSNLMSVLKGANIKRIGSDVVGDSIKMDITNRNDVLRVCRFYQPTLIVNTAAQKLAVLGEANPWPTINISVNGVQNLLNTGVRVVHVSTCKAADPEVAYGIGKAAAEKLVLDAGGTVVRFYNVVEAGPSVYDVWKRQFEDCEPITVTPCTRHVISIREAIGSLVTAMTMPPGRYAVDPGEAVSMREYAKRLFPHAVPKPISPRRGDRLNEPLHARCEHLEQTEIPYLNRIVSQHDLY